jgi:PKHD-type hydroxylase|tara:strand:+ start:449 stop:1204 length:756 start_codon:yes stop_codon:yes gene_type:complete
MKQKEYWEKSSDEVVIDNKKKLDEMRRKSINAGDYDYVNENLMNIQYQFVNPDSMPTADYQVFPTHLKNNWDWPVDEYHEEEFLTNGECDLILSKWPNLLDMEEAEYDVTSARVCDIKWVTHYKPNWEWLFDKLHTKLKSINDRFFKLNLTDPVCIESLQFTKYESGGHYKSHLDWKGRSTFSTRKLSFTINLSDPDDYTGGGLKIYPRGYPTKNKGNIIVFPSFIRHEALTVTTGTRYALISWVNGDAFK